MSQNVWTVYGYGVDLNQSVEKSDIEQIKNLILNNIDVENAFNINVDDVSKADSMEELVDMFEDAETEFGDAGLYAIIGEIISNIFNDAGYDDLGKTACDFNKDSHWYWLIGTVYPWYKPTEKFEQDFHSSEDVLPIIQKLIPEINFSAFDYVSINNCD